MVNTIFILNQGYKTSHILSANKNSQKAFWDDIYTQEFDTGAETFEFSCYASEEVVEGNYVIFYYNNQYKMFTIMDIEEEHKKGKLVTHCYCEISALSLLNNHIRPFKGDMNCIQFFEYVLQDTGWYIGECSESLQDKVETINVSKTETAWSLIEDYKDIYECELNVRVTYENGYITGRYIDIYSDGGLGTPTYKRFEYGRNVTGIIKQKDLYDWCTAIIVDCECNVNNTIINESDGYGFTKGAGDLILDDNANRMYNAGRNYVVGVYEGDETEPVEACINAWKQLQKRKEPKFDYKVTTALTDDEYEEIHLGDTVHVVDYGYTPPLFLEARVGKLELSFTNRTENTCTLTNYKEIKSKLLSAEYTGLTGTITDIVNTFFPITSEGIADGAIVDGKIETKYYQQITTDIVSASKVVAEELIAKEIIAIEGKFEDIEAGSVTTEDLEAINATIENLKANKAEIKDLTATNGEIANLETVVGNIQTLLNGNLTSDNIQSFNITADKVTVADAFIKDAMIDTINANKISTGQLNTSLVTIGSEDGSMILNGSLQQFKDSEGRVRIQIGKDAQGNFTFTLFDETGTGVLINEDGITGNAISEGLIIDNMVAGDANINGSKLDINSVINRINNDGSASIDSSKIYFDDTNQSLEVAFNSLKTKVETFEDLNLEGDLGGIIEQVTTNTTQLGVQQGQINTLIANTTITTENAEGGSVTTTLKDAYSQFTQDLGGFKTEVNELVSTRETAMKTEIDGMLKENYVPKEEYSLFQESYTSNMEQTAQSIDMVFTQTQANITEVDSKMTQFEESMSQYIRFGAEGIELGETASSFKAKLDNEKLAFVEGDTEVAHISNKTMHITDARVNTSLQIGQFRFLPRTNGNLSFTWVTDVNVVLEEGEE